MGGFVVQKSSFNHGLHSKHSFSYFTSLFVVFETSVMKLRLHASSLAVKMSQNFTCGNAHVGKSGPQTIFPSQKANLLVHVSQALSDD